MALTYHLRSKHFLSFGLTIFTCLFIFKSSTTTQTIRRPSSIDQLNGKARNLAGLSAKKIKKFQKQSKGNASIEIEIDAPEKGIIEKGSLINFEATIEAKENIYGLKYVWLFPESKITPMNGAVEGDLGNLNESESAIIRFSVRSETTENQRVHLHVFRLVNGEAQGQMAQYNTVDQENIESVASSKAEVLRQSSEASGKRLKLIQ